MNRDVYVCMCKINRGMLYTGAICIIKNEKKIVNQHRLN